MSAVGLFPQWQPEYAAHKIATFPVRISADDKRPAVKHYKKIGLPASAQLATKFENDNAFGFMLDDRTNITVLDIDDKSERILAAALDRHGATPIVIRSVSGHHQAWYRRNGERHRFIKPWPGRPIDLLGAGFVVAPPSTTERGGYRFIQGSLDDLDRLPVLRNLDMPKAGAKQGARNNQLWRHCMRHAHHVDSFDALLDVARTFNDNCEPPMEDTEVMSVAQSAWRITERGDNRFGTHGAWFPLDEVNQLIGADPQYLLTFLRAHNGPDATFMCANGLADKFGWHRIRLANARRRLIELGYLVVQRNAGQHNPALFRWSRRR
jgi:Bifunctional DNA primase/polymerase, N-terminal/Primase C terminal 1 (PriCT-1)